MVVQIVGVLVAGLAFFGVGLWVGRVLRRQEALAAAAEARQAADQALATARAQLAAREEQQLGLRSELSAAAERGTAAQQRAEQLAVELARARSAAEQAVELKASLEAEAATVDRLQAELREAEVRRAQTEQALEQLAPLQGELAARATELNGLRERAQQLAEAFAKSDAERGSFGKRLVELGQELRLRDEEIEAMRLERQGLLEVKARLESQLSAEREAIERVRAEVQTAAGKLVDEKGQALLNQSQEELLALLNPVKEQLKEFGATVVKTYDQENRDRASLLQSLKLMQDTQARLHHDAEALTKALTGDSKAQGDWGELQLERLFETVGLTEGREYALQVSHVDEDGSRKRPDALVYLPANRAVVVDAKCSLTAFVESTRAEGEALGVAIQAHLASVRGHVRELAEKNYQALLGSRTLDTVLMFVPNEAAFHAAVANDPGLYDEAFRQGVLICSPTTLLAALQMIRHVWRTENQNVNAQKIAEEAGRMVDKLAAFVGDLDEVGRNLVRAEGAFTKARRKLTDGPGNLIGKATAVAQLGARVKPEKLEQLMLVAAPVEEEEDEALPALPGGKTPSVS